ncbi:MAG: hypothetical protein AAB531_03105 [Patescibacteria group bacterium]
MLFVVLIFLIRVIFFAADLGGLEHDSGWYLGVARNLAQRGIYASYTNTITEESPGAHPSLHGRFSVQDKNGFSYFPAGVTVGPGYVVPEAILLKIFGYGWWQYRLWPLIGYALLLVTLFYITSRIGNLYALGVLSLWIWAVPQATVGYAFEAYSEHIALLYLLISFLLCTWFITSTKNHRKYLFLAGVFFSFSFLTKNLSFLSFPSFIAIAVFDIWKNRKKILPISFSWSLFAVGIILPIAIYEGYRYLNLTSQFGIEGWQAINDDLRITFQSGGSGISNIDFSKLDLMFVQKKINVWMNVGISQPIFVWVFILFSPLLLYRHLSSRMKILFAMIYISVLSVFFWYIFVSPAGWARHAWTGIFQGMIIASISIGYLFSEILKNKKKYIYFLFLLIASTFLLVRYESVNLSPFLTQKTIDQWRGVRFITGLEGFPSTPTLSLSDQKGLVDFFEHNIKKNDRIYYLGWFLNAEVSPFVDKVFYTLNRYFAINQRNPEGGISYAILGPYQQGPWSFEPPEYVPNKVSELCNKVVYANSSYLLCTLKTGLIYNNPAY